MRAGTHIRRALNEAKASGYPGAGDEQPTQRHLRSEGLLARRLTKTKTATKLEPINLTGINKPGRTITTTAPKNVLRQANLIAPAKRRMY